MIIKLNKKFYSRTAIESSIQDYKGFCDAELKEDNTHFIAIFNNKTDASDEELRKEFCNYCLCQMK